MRLKSFFTQLAAAPLLSACVSTETVRFQASDNQQAMVRDGRQAIASKRMNSIVLVSPASREFQSGSRPVFVVGINNLAKQPLNCAVADISVHQKAADGRIVSLPVKTYDELVAEERSKQVARVVLVGLAAGANAVAASQARYGTARANVYSTIYTPYGSYNRVSTVTASYFDPTAARCRRPIPSTLLLGLKPMRSRSFSKRPGVRSHLRSNSVRLDLTASDL